MRAAVLALLAATARGQQCTGSSARLAPAECAAWQDLFDGESPGAHGVSALMLTPRVPLGSDGRQLVDVLRR